MKHGNPVLIIGSTEAKTQPKWYVRWRRCRWQNAASI